MEKLLDFKKGEPIEGVASKYYRFQCDCLNAADAMTLGVDSCGKNDEGKFFTICMDFYGTGVWDRIKYAWQILRSQWSWREFIIREDDLKPLINILNPDKKFSELP